MESIKTSSGVELKVGQLLIDKGYLRWQITRFFTVEGTQMLEGERPYKDAFNSKVRMPVDEAVPETKHNPKFCNEKLQREWNDGELNLSDIYEGTITKMPDGTYMLTIEKRFADDDSGFSFHVGDYEYYPDTELINRDLRTLAACDIDIKEVQADENANLLDI